MSLIHNERIKLIANALDRASTAALAIGVFGPIAATLYRDGGATYDWRTVVGPLIWLSGAVLLHSAARRTIRRLL